MQVAVLGGGLSGLSAALSLSYRLPKAQISLFEKSARLGGWAHTEAVDLSVGRVLLEGGPRTLRPNGAALLELVKNLNLEKELILVPKSSPASKNRYVYLSPGQLPGLQGLHTVGSNLTSPVMRRFLLPLMLSPFRFLFWKNTKDGNDESIHSFATRMVDEDMARVLISAIVHGVYASDSRQISAHSTLPFFTPHNHGKRVLTNSDSGFELDLLEPHPNVGHLAGVVKDVSVYSFKSGMETLVRAMENKLEERSNVQIYRSSPVFGLLMNKGKSFELTHLSPHETSSSVSTANPTHIVNALPLPTFHNIIKDTYSSSSYTPSLKSQYISSLPPLPHLTTNPSSTVQVVNLVFPVPPCQIHPPGFGYLIPRPKEGYPSEANENQPGILGTVFDSCSLSEQDDGSMSSEEFYYKGGFTKITVMLGGPYPLLIPSSAPSTPTSAPTPTLTTSSNSNSNLTMPQTPIPISIPPYIRIILNNLSKHLSRPIPDPIYYRIWQNKNCIPSYTLGHRERVRELKEVLKGGQNQGQINGNGWDGRIEVIGAGVDGVSVSDCIGSGRNVGLSWV